MNILEEIVAHKRKELRERIAAEPLEGLREQSAGRTAPGFITGLRRAPIGLIAEVKHRSPSAGIIRDPFEPEDIARAYRDGGAQAVSVLMDQEYFGGGAWDFNAVRQAVDLPMLYKEFVVDPWQVWHAASLGASAVLLIAGVLNRQELGSLVEVCRETGVEPLLEVHDEQEMDVACDTEVTCVGINNRDLKTFTVSLDNTFRLMDRAPQNALVISESGIRFPEDVVRLKDGGVQAILVGEHLLKQLDIKSGISTLMGAAWGSS